MLKIILLNFFEQVIVARVFTLNGTRFGTFGI